MVHPAADDVVVRPQASTDNPAYLLATFSGPDQIFVGTREHAVSQAIAYAQHQHVRAWFATGEHDFVLLGTFRPDEPLPATPLASDTLSET